MSKWARYESLKAKKEIISRYNKDGLCHVDNAAQFCADYLAIEWNFTLSGCRSFSKYLCRLRFNLRKLQVASASLKTKKGALSMLFRLLQVAKVKPYQ